MADPQQTLSFDPQAFVILAQIFGAFVHGAEGMAVADEVFLEATEQYKDVAARDARYWRDDRTQVLYLAHSMGRVAAYVALGENRLFISRSDYRRARQTVHDSAGFEIKLDCPFDERKLG